METAINLIMIIVSTVLIFVVLLQARGGGLGRTFGDTGSMYQTRRGLEKTLFQFTIAIAAVFLLVAIISTIVQ